MTTVSKFRTLLDLDDLSGEEIRVLLDRARELACLPPQRDLLRDVCVVNLFFEPSTRTYTSFAIAEARVGADVVSLLPEASSLGKGETILDTALTLAAMGVRVIVTRHPESGFPYHLAEAFEGHVINAGDGKHAHPTQALLDLMTLQAEVGKGGLEGLHVAIVGDISHSRVARSNIIGLRALGAEVILIGPPTLLPENFAREGVRVERDLDAVLPEIDVVMLLRIQRERIEGALLPSLDDYVRNYRLDGRRLGMLRPEAIVMHPGPYNRGVELTEEVLSFRGWRYAQQVAHGVPVRMAVLDFVVNGVRTANTFSAKNGYDERTGVREEILAAAHRLHDAGHPDFTPDEIIRLMQSNGTTYLESTIRTYICSVMCVQAPKNHAIKYDDLDRIDHGKYRLRGYA